MSDDDTSAPTGGIDMESNFPIDGADFAPLEVGQERDLTTAKDGGCVKKLLVAGEGFKTPEKGDEVTGAWRAGRAAAAAAACRGRGFETQRRRAG
jgi:hypothetical protein